MSLVTAISDGISDRLNPIVIKELRQAVQSRFVSVAMMIFLGIQVLVIGAFIAFDDSIATDFSSGGYVFMALHGILLATCILFVPAYTGIRLAAERSKVDLMFITAIKPWSIVRGKFLAATVLTLLLFTACMPFMTFTYLLRGVDLPLIFFTLATGFLFVLTCTQLAIFWASIPGNLVIVILLGILLAIFLAVSAGAAAISGTVALVAARYGGPFGGSYVGIGPAMWTWKFWAGAGTSLLTSAMIVGLLMSLSVALLSPLSSNRMFQVRVYITSMWVLSAALAGAWAFTTSSGEPIFTWCVWFMILLIVAMLVAVSEREHWGPRVTRRIPKNPFLRPVAFLFFTGWAGGVAWCVILMALTLIGTAFVHEAARFHLDSRSLVGLVGLGLYAYAYSMTALLLRRAFFRNRVKCGLTGLIAVALYVAAILLPILMFILIHYDRISSLGDQGLWLIGIPFMPFIDDKYLVPCLSFAGTWSVVVFLLSLPWVVGQRLAFKPLQTTPLPIPQSAELPPEHPPAAPD